jgi:hypothetical protein
MPRHATLSHRHTTPRHATPRHATPRHPTPDFMHVKQLKQRDLDDTSLQLALSPTPANIPLPCPLDLQLFHHHAQLQSRRVSRFVRRACTAERSERLPSVAMMLVRSSPLQSGFTMQKTICEYRFSTRSYGGVHPNSHRRILTVLSLLNIQVQ